MTKKRCREKERNPDTHKGNTLPILTKIETSGPLTTLWIEVSISLTFRTSRWPCDDLSVWDDLSWGSHECLELYFEVEILCIFIITSRSQRTLYRCLVGVRRTYIWASIATVSTTEVHDGCISECRLWMYKQDHDTTYDSHDKDTSLTKLHSLTTWSASFYYVFIYYIYVYTLYCIYMLILYIRIHIVYIYCIYTYTYTIVYVYYMYTYIQYKLIGIYNI